MLSPVFIDSSIFIYLFEDHPRFASKIQPVFDSLSENKLSAFTSIISVAEVITKPLEEKRYDFVKQYHEVFQHLPNLKLGFPTYDTAVSAAKIRAEYKFQLIDSFQLAIALENRCLSFLTNDRKLKKFNGLKIILL